MSSVAVFSSNVIEPDLAAGERSRSPEKSFEWLRQRETSYQATGVTLFTERKQWLIEAYKKLSGFASLRAGWDSYGAEAPRRNSVDTARDVLRALADTDWEPTSVDASAEGGVCVSFQHGDRYGDIECFNSGEILAVTSAGGEETEVWEVQPIEYDLSTTFTRIRTFLDR